MTILFLCTGNSCRSQMAGGWVRHLKAGIMNPYSAGIETHGLNPLAVEVMAEAGVDISRQYSKTIEDVKNISCEWFITVCDTANETCPLFPGRVRRFHIGFDDPPRLARKAKNEEETRECYRRVRDEIRQFVESLPDVLT